MHSPTAVTPEPKFSSQPSSRSSLQSMHSFNENLDATSISPSSSPVMQQQQDEAPAHNKVYPAVRKSVLDAIAAEANVGTPNKSPFSQTPLRSTPLLTPPSSDERPLLPPFNPEAFQPIRLERQVPLTEKILAQSALYSQSIQRNRSGSGTAPAAQLKRSLTNIPVDVPPRSRSISTQSLLQVRQHLALPQHQRTSSQESTGSQPFAQSTDAVSSSFTPVDLPLGESLSRSRNSPENRDAKPIPTIPKADPLDNPFNTTNVYINGLPLRWTDDDLYRLTRGFGAIKSVKMFTRHLEDKPSAYGFVLFDSVQDAERFIIALRQHTSFHPSFAKTSKTPACLNSKHAAADPILPSLGGEAYADVSVVGLPLTIDMQTLRALFSPHAIKSSKFFHTTGTTKRLVGFIRLESRQAAEDIIERLHGSNVLGWSEKLSVQLIETAQSQVNVPQFEEHPQADFDALHAQLGAMNLKAGANSVESTTFTHSSLGTPSTVVGTPGLGIPFPTAQPFLSPDIHADDNTHLADVLRARGLHNSFSNGSMFERNQVLQEHLPQNAMALLQNKAYPPLSYSRQQSMFLGLGIPGVASNANSAAAEQAVLKQQYLQLQDLVRSQQVHFQNAFGASQETLDALQALVAAQDNHAPAAPGGLDIPFGMSGLNRPAMKIPPPILTSLNRAPFGERGVAPGGQVPQLLPPLSPSVASSAEPSPLTPTFEQAVRGNVLNN